MSARLSVTTITCAETMLNAATATMSVRMMNITRFSICHRAEEIRVVARPVADVGVDGQLGEELHRDARRGEHVVELQPDAAGIGQPVQLLRVLDVDERQPAVELEHADFENAADVERLEARQRACRRDHALRRDGDDRIADAQAERARELRAEHDVEAARRQRGELAALHVAADVGDSVFLRRHHAAEDRAAIGVAGGQHRLPEHVRCGCDHARVALRHLDHGRGILELGESAYLDMRRDGQDARAELLLESVHHRQHDDQRSDAERDARHRDQRDERDERVAARALAGTRVPQADGQFVGRQSGEVCACREPSGVPVDDVLIHEGTNDALVKRLSHARVDGRRAKAFH